MDTFKEIKIFWLFDRPETLSLRCTHTGALQSVGLFSISRTLKQRGVGKYVFLETANVMWTMLCIGMCTQGSYYSAFLLSLYTKRSLSESACIHHK